MTQLNFVLPHHRTLGLNTSQYMPPRHIKKHETESKVARLGQHYVMLAIWLAMVATVILHLRMRKRMYKVQSLECTLIRV